MSNDKLLIPDTHVPVLKLANRHFITTDEIADHLGISFRRATAYISDLIMMGYLRLVPIDGARWFRATTLGEEALAYTRA